MAPESEYFGGHGTKVMSQMRKKHGARAKEVFHRTANKMKSAMKKSMHGGRVMTEAELCKGYMVKK